MGIRNGRTGEWQILSTFITSLDQSMRSTLCLYSSVRPVVLHEDLVSTSVLCFCVSQVSISSLKSHALSP